MKTLLLLILFLISGCSWQHADGTRRHLVLGIGVIDVDSPNHHVDVGAGVDATAVRWRAMGAMLGGGPGFRGLGVGVLEHRLIEVAPDSNLLLDWRCTPSRSVRRESVSAYGPVARPVDE